MKFKFILSLALCAGTTFYGNADGYLDGVEYYQVGQDENAEIVLTDNLDKPETDKAVAYYYLGNIALHKGDLAQAEKYFDLGIQTNPEYAFNYIGKGAIVLKKGVGVKDAEKQAKEFFKQAEKIDKKDAKVKVDIARVYYDIDSVLYKKELNDYLKDARKKNEKEASIYIFEGDMYADQKDYGKSAGRYDMAILFDNNRPVAYVKYANTYFHIAPDMAISRLKEIADRQPNSLLAQRELAEKYYENNQWTMAAEQYQKVIDNPNHFPSDEVRYVVLLYFGERYQESMDLARQLAAENHSPFLMKRMLFLNAAALENYPEAETLAKDFFTMQETDINTFTANDYTTYGNVLLELEKADDAAVAYENALKVSPEKKEILKDLSNAYSIAASVDKNPALYQKSAEAFQKFIDSGEYEKDYELNDLYILTGRYQNVIATAQDSIAKTDAYKKGVETIDLVLSKATKDYRLSLRKARIIRLYYGVEVFSKDAVDAYLLTEGIVNSDTDIAPEQKQSVLNEIYTYVGSYYLVQMQDTPTAKVYFEKAYEITPEGPQKEQLRNYIDNLK